MESTLPDEQRQAVADLATMTDASFAVFLEGLKLAKPTLLLTAFVKEIGATPGVHLNEEQVRRLVTFLLGLYSSKYAAQQSADQVVKSVVDAALAKTVSGDPAVHDSIQTNSVRLEQRLLELLKFDRLLGMSAKASWVAFEHPKAFVESEIFTDVRLIFGPTDESVDGAIVIHSLRITYVQGGSNREIYIALNESDLISLQQTIQTAAQKQRLIEESLAKSGATSIKA